MENHIEGESKTGKPWYKKWWVIAIILITIFAIIGSSNNNSPKELSSSNSESQVKSEEVAVIASKEPEMILTSAQLVKAYAENEVSADAEYKGKVLEVTGTVNGIDNGITDNDMIVKLSDGQQYSFNDTWCYADPSEKDKVLALKKDTPITVIGTNEGATLGSPILRECRIK